MTKLNTTRRRVAAGAVALATVPVLVVAAQPMTATGSTSAETLTFRSKGQTFRQIDHAPKGQHPSAGDSFVVTNGLYKSGDRIGTLHATCVVTRRTANPNRTPLLCHGVYKLPGGGLAGIALITGASDITRIAIGGGTGKYAGASGQAVEETINNNVAKVTVTLQ